MMRRFALPVLAVLALSQTSMAGEPRLLLAGQAGVLGEWELAGELRARGPGGNREFFGELAVKHVGLCTQDGPESKVATITLRLSRAATRVVGRMRLDGAECAFTGRKDHGYHGIMNCADRQPQPLILWIKGPST